ncbi:hypothetical protein [Alysiella crassa]|uniref:Uncharacterized protein n=1 Tax=Alysiella crassa TaxID=153491 RepID=A0A376BKI2_9NEIS|nr:hypothetical protein [Alysiella crassa]UOP07532.1 hypothetical protein LVJ80_03785 [Alysiella crassa]SSY70262.1 Uncharacterised protein [Alysiella crassa]
MQLAEIVYENDHAFLKLPETWLAKGKSFYIQQKPNGNLELIQQQGDWDELFQELRQIGEIEPLEDVVRTNHIQAA